MFVRLKISKLLASKQNASDTARHPTSSGHFTQPVTAGKNHRGFGGFLVFKKEFPEIPRQNDQVIRILGRVLLNDRYPRSQLPD